MSKPKTPTQTPKPEGARKEEGEFLPPAQKYQDIDQATIRQQQQFWEEDTINYGEKPKEEIVDYQPPQRKSHDNIFREKP